jgi:hypothetical protein
MRIYADCDHRVLPRVSLSLVRNNVVMLLIILVQAFNYCDISSLDIILEIFFDFLFPSITIIKYTSLKFSLIILFSYVELVFDI